MLAAALTIVFLVLIAQQDHLIRLEHRICVFESGDRRTNTAIIKEARLHVRPPVPLAC